MLIRLAIVKQRVVLSLLEPLLQKNPSSPDNYRNNKPVDYRLDDHGSYAQGNAHEHCFGQVLAPVAVHAFETLRAGGLITRR